MTDEARRPTDTPLYPIREVSRLTGVNSVTLRAWERRYGLIKPQRTPKGHRLYAREDIERVERILQWLNRGVPVSQVRELLDQPETAETPTPAAGDWPGQRRLLISAVQALDLTRLEELFNQSLALYPVPLCLTELWQPVIRQLEESWGDQLGDALQRRTLETFLRTRIGTRLLHANRLGRGPTLLIVPLPDDPAPLWVLLTALSASDCGYRVHLFDAPLPCSELPLAVERFQAQALLLASGKAEKAELVRRQLPRLAEQLEIPLMACGPMARIREADLEDTEVELLGDDLGEAMQCLQARLPVR